jgi:signal transduction histidine kinase
VVNLPQGQASGQGHGAGRGFTQAPSAIGADEASPARADSRTTTAAPEAAQFRQQPDGISPSAPDRQHSRTGTTPDSGRQLRNWPVRSRLLLLAVIPALTTVAFGIVLITSSLRRASTASVTGSVSHGAMVSALVYGTVVIVVVLLVLLLTSVVARSIVGPLHRLQDGALEVTEVLPDAVRRISETDGEGVSLNVRPIGLDSRDEIGVVARAFDQMSEEALRLAANEAALRGNVSAIFVNLSRRSQSLVERQISLIDGLEQGEQDAERLANLFKMDHLATRMRRNSENLLVLAGHELLSPGNQPVALVDVIRGAVSEIEEYERVRLDVQQGLMVKGPAVNDVVHTIAELAENATSLSAAGTDVKISGHLLTSGGALIDITDQGVGMSAQELERANWQLENPPLVNVDVSRRMGLFVVGRLARRHGIRVRLRPAPNGGVSALVWLPDEVITQENTPAQPRLGGLRTTGPGSLETGPLWPVSAGGMDADGRRTAQEVTAARTPKFAPPRADGPGAPVDPRRIPGPDSAGTTGGEAGIAGREASPIAGEAAADLTRGADVTALPRRAGWPVAGDADGALPRRAGWPAAGDADDALPRRAGWPAAGDADDAPATAASSAASAPFSPETGSADSSVIVPPAEAPEGQRLPVFEAVESDWFRRVHKGFGLSATAAETNGDWASPADDGWRAAETVASPSSSGVTEAGLPKRIPQANLVPGAVGSAQTAEASPKPAGSARSPASTRERLASFQRGVAEGRAAVSPGGDPGEEDGSS